jgi:ankyrin repeat protein
MDLLVAARDGKIDTVRALISNPDVDVNHQDVKGKSALSLAAKNGHLDIVKLLLGTPQNIQNKGRALLEATENGHDKIVKAIVENDKTVVDYTVSWSTTTALTTAIHKELYKIVEILLVNNASVTGDDAWYIVTGDNIDMVKILISHSNINKRYDQDRSTLLHLAASEGNIDVLKLLLENGAKPVVTNRRNKSAVDVARDEENYDAAEFIEDYIKNMRPSLLSIFPSIVADEMYGNIWDYEIGSGILLS